MVSSRSRRNKKKYSRKRRSSKKRLHSRKKKCRKSKRFRMLQRWRNARRDAQRDAQSRRGRLKYLRQLNPTPRMKKSWSRRRIVPKEGKIFFPASRAEKRLGEDLYELKKNRWGKKILTLPLVHNCNHLRQWSNNILDVGSTRDFKGSWSKCLPMGNQLIVRLGHLYMGVTRGNSSGWVFIKTLK